MNIGDIAQEFQQDTSFRSTSYSTGTHEAPAELEVGKTHRRPKVG